MNDDKNEVMKQKNTRQRLSRDLFPPSQSRQIPACLHLASSSSDSFRRSSSVDDDLFLISASPRILFVHVSFIFFRLRRPV